MFIYLIINAVTGKYYIGQHKGFNLKQYLQKKFYDANHNRGGQSYLYASMRKYGRDVFSIHALRSDIRTKKELDRLEKLFIISLDSRNPEVGYNICRGGEGFTGSHSPETRKALGDAAKKMWKNPIIRQSIVSKMKNHLVSDNVIAFCRAKKGIKHTPEAVENMSRAHIGKKASLETRYKMAESRRGQKRSLTTRQLLSAQKLGNLNPMKNPETAHKVSNALIGRKQSFETNAKRAATMRLVWATRRAAHGLKG
jgi:group I intron endonuclease